MRELIEAKYCKEFNIQKPIDADMECEECSAYVASLQEPNPHKCKDLIFLRWWAKDEDKFLVLLDVMGRVAIPKKHRDCFELEAGDYFAITISDVTHERDLERKKLLGKIMAAVKWIFQGSPRTKNTSKGESDTREGSEGFNPLSNSPDKDVHDSTGSETQ